jgi:hypothetical protein
MSSEDVDECDELRMGDMPILSWFWFWFDILLLSRSPREWW